MARDLTIDWLGRRYDPSAGKGHLESYFLRANHPTEPRAFWLKATIWAPIDGEAVAEAWCITFDRAGATWAAKTTAPFADSRFSEDALDIEIAGCRFRFGLDGGEASGRMKDGERRWDVRWTSVGGVLGSPVRRGEGVKLPPF